nr:macrophage migration inhibitory factor-like [Lytechinus pictus]
MPILQILTNVTEDNIPKDYLTELTSVLAEATKKEKKYKCIHVSPNQQLSFGGSTAPCAIANVICLGQQGVEENKIITKLITAALGKINVTPDRMYVIFRDIAGQDVGYNNTTCAGML